MTPLLFVLAIDVTVRLHWIERGPESRTIRMPMEEYVAGVLAGEASTMQSPESLRAMAVAARTYAAKFRGRHRREGFDFCDTTHCQDLRISAVTDRVREAAAATEGELLWYRGALVAAYYSKHCGGMSEASPEGPYLDQHRDPYCLRQPDRWRTVLSREELLEALAATRLPVPRAFTQIAVTGRTPSNRATRMNLSGFEIDGPMFAQAVGRKLGWDKLPSRWFDVASFGDRFVFQGRGRGHGIGLCQNGCARMGEEGKPYREILDFYYPKTVVGLTAQGFQWKTASGERVDVRFATDPAVAAADRAVVEAERLSGLTIATRPRLVFYPSLAAFRDATGEPGSVAAATRGATIRLQPVEMLRSRRVLDSTLVHEMLHVALEARAEVQHPWWFREGLVLALTRESPVDARYRDAAVRVNELLNRHGRDVVFGWWQRGLPRDVDPQSVQGKPAQPKAQSKAR